MGKGANAMNKVEKVFTLIYNDSKLKEELIKKQTIDEMYEYCTSISDGYTKEEFEKFVNEMCQYVEEELTNKNLSISDEDMKKVSGGTQLKNKAISSLLAAMAISTPLVGAASNNQENTDIPVESKTSITQKIKNFVSKNPIKTKATAAGISVMALLGWELHNKNVKEEQRKKTLEKEVELAGQRRRVQEEARRAQEAERQNRLVLYTASIDNEINKFNDEISAQQGPLASALAKLQNPGEVTDENISAANKALDTFGSFLAASNTRIDNIRIDIEKMSSGEDKNTLQNKYDALYRRISKAWLEFGQMRDTVNKKEQEKEKATNLRNIVNRPRV